MPFILQGTQIGDIFRFGFLGQVRAAPPQQNLTNNTILQLPINAVIAGQQPGDLEEKKAKVLVDLTGIVRRIFGE